MRALRKAPQLLQRERDNSEFLVRQLGLAQRAPEGLRSLNQPENDHTGAGIGPKPGAVGFSEGSGKEKHFKACF